MLSDNIEDGSQFPPGQKPVLTAAEIQLHFDTILNKLLPEYGYKDVLLVNYILELASYYARYPEYQGIIFKSIVSEIRDYPDSYNSSLGIHLKENVFKEKFINIYNLRELQSERKEEVNLFLSNILFNEKKRSAYFLYSITLFSKSLDTLKDKSYLKALDFIAKIKSSLLSNPHEKFIELMALYDLSELFVNLHRNSYDKYLGIKNTDTWQKLMFAIRRAAYVVMMDGIKDADSYNYIKHLRFIKNLRIMNEHRSNDPTLKLFKRPTQTIKLIDKRIAAENIDVANQTKMKINT